MAGIKKITGDLTVTGTITGTISDNVAPSLGISSNQINVTAGGKTSSNITVPYATNAGSATSAEKLSTISKGSATQPIYWTDGGIPAACTYSLNKTVPADAVFTDNNTTYTFENGTNCFYVTPSNGSKQTVNVTPSITNNITGSGTSGNLTKFNGTNTITNGPAIGTDTTKYLRNDGSWVTPPNTTYSNATTTTNGLMSSTDKSKLDGIASGAEVNVQADWNATSGDSFINNKPTKLSAFTNDPGYITGITAAMVDNVGDITNNTSGNAKTATTSSNIAIGTPTTTEYLVSTAATAGSTGTVNKTSISLSPEAFYLDNRVIYLSDVSGSSDTTNKFSIYQWADTVELSRRDTSYGRIDDAILITFSPTEHINLYYATTVSNLTMTAPATIPSGSLVALDSSGNLGKTSISLTSSNMAAPSQFLWVQGGSEAGGDTNRLTTTSGMPGNMQYNSGHRGTQIYSNGIAFADPYNGNDNSDASWIRHLETTTNQGVLEIATNDDDNDIVFRKYDTDNNIAQEIWLPRTSGTIITTANFSLSDTTLTITT